MIVAAGLLVLTGLGLFLAGVMTGTNAYFWACVAVCVAAAVLLFLARRRISRAEAALPDRAPSTTPAATAASATAGTTPAGESSSPTATAATTSAVTATGATAVSAAPQAAHSAPEPRSEEAAGVPAAAAAPPPPPRSVAPVELEEPPIEDVEVTDLLMVVDLKDDVFVVDEHPRYHVESCRFLIGRTGIPLPMDEARTDGFTPCALCTPDRVMAGRARARRTRG